MKSILRISLLLTLVAVSTVAQTPEPNVGTHFAAETGYVNLGDGGSATVITGRLPVTARWSVLYRQFQIPSANAQVFLGGAEFRDKLSHIFTKNANAASQVNLDRIEVYGRVGVGSRRDSQGNEPTFAYGLFGGANVRINETISVGVEFGFMRAPLRRENLFVSNMPTVAPGIQLRF